MPLKLLAIDVDGTLAVDPTAIPPRTHRVISAAMAQGVTVALATGRAYDTTSEIARQLQLNAPVICYHGGLVRDHRTDETLLAEYIPLDISRQIIKYARGKKMPMAMFMTQDNFTELPTTQMERQLGENETLLTIVHNLLCLLDEASQPIKFLFVQSREHNGPVFQRIQSKYGQALTIVRSGDTYVEAFLPSVSKGKALQFLAERLGIPLAHTMAIGDHDNDISMLEIAGTSVAMGNGSLGAKSAADVVAPTVEEEGVAWAIEQYILAASTH